MAIISRTHNYLFLLSPRTASTAVAQGVLLPSLDGHWLLDRHLEDEHGHKVMDRKHATPKDIVDHGFLTEDEMNDLLVFTTVRNPWDREVSAYVKMRTDWQASLAKPGFWEKRPRRAAELRMAKELDFPAFIQYRYRRFSWRWRLVDARRRALPVPFGRRMLAGADVIMRFERLQQDFDALLRRLGIEGSHTIPKINETSARRRDYRSYYDRRSRRLVAALYRPEIERFGYRF